MMEGLKLQLILFAPKLAAAVAILIGFWIASSLLSRFIAHFGIRINLDTHVLALLKKTTKAIMLIIGGVTALGTLGVNVSALVASLGLVGFALGFALKDAVSNLLAGVLILVYQPFKINDRIEVAGHKGIVTNIDLRYTTIQENDKRILLPNSTLFTKAIAIIDDTEG